MQCLYQKETSNCACDASHRLAVDEMELTREENRQMWKGQ